MQTLHPTVSLAELQERSAEWAQHFRGPRLTAIIPDTSRSGGSQIGAALRGIYKARADKLSNFTVLVAYGTHTAPTDPVPSISNYLGISQHELSSRYPLLHIVAHNFRDDANLHTVGHLDRHEILELSDGVLDVATLGLPDMMKVRFNRLAVDADDVCIIGPVLPHEVVGCSGGYKYFTPGVGDKTLTDVTHWFGALQTISETIGLVDTPVRRLITRCAKMNANPRHWCIATVPDQEVCRGVYFGSPETAHAEAASRTREINIVRTGRQFSRVIAVLSSHYVDLWTGGKGSYKLIQLVKPGGELLIVSEHIVPADGDAVESAVSHTWWRQIASVGYHCLEYVRERLDYLLKSDVDPTVLAHLTHVYGPGCVHNGNESPSVVKLSTGFSREFCERRLNLGYSEMAVKDIAQFVGDEDTYVEFNAGQRLCVP